MPLFPLPLEESRQAGMMSYNLDFVLSHKQSILLLHTIINKAFLATDLTTYMIPQLGPVVLSTLNVFSSMIKNLLILLRFGEVPVLDLMVRRHFLCSVPK